MILVLLGTQDKSFKRLLDAIQKQIDLGVITDKVIVQSGHTKYESEDMEIFDLIPMADFDDLVTQADIIITHAGVGSLVGALKKNKIIIAAARLKKYNEHTNDHQLQILKNFSEAGYILALQDFDKLDELLMQAQEFAPKIYESNTQAIIGLIEQFINEL